MPSKIFTLSCCSAALFLGLVVLPSSARAGFQWVETDSVGAVAPKSSPVYKGRAAVKKPEAVSPLIATTPSSVPSSGRAPSLPPRTHKPLSAPTFAGGGETISESRPFLSSSVTTEEVVQGFATKVPLALALRQILPATHSFSIEQNVDMNTLVSYQGGSPWRETVAVMLEPAGLEFVERSAIVVVGRKGMLPRPVAAPLATREVAAHKEVAVALPVRAPDVRNVGREARGSIAGCWTAERGETLRAVLMRWCERMGVELKWIAEYDYPVEASAQFKGRFEDAVRGLLAGFDSARPQPVGSLHANARAGQRVLVVQARGNSYTN